MAKYFTVSELLSSGTARRLGIDNTPPLEAAVRLDQLAEHLLDPVRELWGTPIVVNSGYRCEELNRLVGGAASSQHIAGEAADITAGSPEKNEMLFTKIVDAAEAGLIEFDQLIDELGYSWLHLSFRTDGNRRQILHLWR